MNQENYSSRILVIDDNRSIHKDFRAIFENPQASQALCETRAAIFGSEQLWPKCNFRVDSAYQGKQGLQMMIEADSQGDPYIMAFIDVRMPPGWDGIETTARLWQQFPQLQIVLCTAYSDHSWEEVTQKLGQTDRLLILKKPFDNIEVRQIACSLTEKWHLIHNLDEIVKRRTSQIEQTRDVTVFALASLAESRDPETGKHLERIRSYCAILADQLSKTKKYCHKIEQSFKENLYRSSPLHDIGKVGIPDSILLKPGTLTDQEFEIMKQHAAIGAESLQRTVANIDQAGFLSMAVKIAKHHHERFNGKGYPDGLSGENIPLAARIVALADVYDALTTARVYKSPFRPEVAKTMITEQSGEHFDPDIVKAFLEREDEFTAVLNQFNNANTVVTSSEYADVDVR